MSEIILTGHKTQIKKKKKLVWSVYHRHVTGIGWLLLTCPVWFDHTWTKMEERKTYPACLSIQVSAEESTEYMCLKSSSPIITVQNRMHAEHTIMILSFRTDRSGQTVQTQIRLLLEQQSDLGLHCLQFRLHRLDPLLFGKAIMFKF